MRLGLYADYQHDETTSMACSLGDLARLLGFTVSYLAPCRRPGRIWRYWDSRVQSARRRDFRDWACRQDSIVWFVHEPEKLRQAQDLSCNNVLVADIHTLRRQDVELLNEYQAVVAPCQHSGRLLNTFGVNRLVAAPWYPGPRPIVRGVEPAVPGKTRICVHVPWRCRQATDELLAAVRISLSRRPELEITLLTSGSWKRPVEDCARRIAGDTRRLYVRCRASYVDRAEEYAQHDWVICPHVVSNGGYYALESLVHGCPVVAPVTPTLQEILQPAHNGALFRRETTELQELGVHPPQLVATDYLTMLDEFAARPDSLRRLKGRKWSELEVRSSNFLSRWKAIWDC